MFLPFTGVEGSTLLINTYIKDSAQREYPMDTVPCAMHETDWALESRWIPDQCSIFGECSVAFAAVEGIFFSGSFTSLDALAVCLIDMDARLIWWYTEFIADRLLQ